MTNTKSGRGIRRNLPYLEPPIMRIANYSSQKRKDNLQISRGQNKRINLVSQDPVHSATSK